MSASIVENKKIYLSTKCKQYGRSTRKLLAEVITVARRRLAKQCQWNDFACWRLQAARLRNTSLVNISELKSDLTKMEFSLLPDDPLLHILSYLRFTDLTRFVCVRRKN